MTRELPQGWFCHHDIVMYRSIFNSLEPTAITVEVGSWKGRSLASVADIILARQIRAVSVDTFKGSQNDPAHLQEANRVNIYEEFLRNMKNFEVLDRLEILVMDSVAASQKFPEEYFDFIFIDADHSYAAVAADLKAWRPKLKPTGIIGGHDYAHNFPGIRRAVDEVFSKDVLTVHTAAGLWTAAPQKLFAEVNKVD